MPNSSNKKLVESIILDLRARGLLGLAEVIARQHHVTVAEMLGPRRFDLFCIARQELWAHVHEIYHSTPLLGEIFDRDHSTIQAGIRAHHNRGGTVNQAEIEKRGDW